MARDESPAARRLRELQESPGRTKARPTGPPTTNPWRKRIIVGGVGLGAVTLSLGMTQVLDEVVSRVGSSLDSGSDVARSFEEADSVQSARGREAVEVVESLDYPAGWTARDDTSIAMDDGGEGSSYAFYDVSFTVPTDYSGDDFSTWFAEEETVTSSAGEDVTCSTTDGGQELSCEIRFEPDETSTDGEPIRQTVTVTYTAATGTEEGAVAVRGYSTQY